MNLDKDIVERLADEVGFQQNGSGQIVVRLPNGNCVAVGGRLLTFAKAIIEHAQSDEPSHLVEENARLRKKNETLWRGLMAVELLITESGGVYGLHLNGDNQDWDGLLEGGYYEDWLIDFSKAVKDDKDE